jgi:mercuric reductase
VPRVTFTDPQVAAVGMTEVEAREAGLTPQVTSLAVTYLPRAAVSHRHRGVIKLVSEVGTDRLIGAHVVAPNAGDVIGEAVLAVRFGLATRDLVSTLHPYLTWGEGLKLAAQTFTKDVSKLSCCAGG